MTKEEKLKAYELRLNGYTLRETAEKLGVSYDAIQDLTPPTKRAVFRKSLEKCIYPNIRAWMLDTGHTYTSFGKMMVYSGASVQRGLTGTYDMPKVLIDKILETTKMTYEVAFSTKAMEPEKDIIARTKQ